MKSATLGFLCCKSCPSALGLDSCRGERIAPISQAGGWADSDTDPDQSQIAGGCAGGLTGKFRLQTCMDLEGKLGQKLFNSKYRFVLQDVRGRQTSASFGVRWSCGQQQGEENGFGRAGGRQQLAVVGRIEGHWQVCWDQPGTKEQTPLHISNFLFFSP